MANDESMKTIKRIWANLSKRGLLRCCACELLIRNANDITYDHYKPRSLGGDVSFKNGRPMHKRCNSAKGNLPADVWEKNKWKILAEHGIATIQDYDLPKVLDSEVNFVELDGEVYQVSYTGEISKSGSFIPKKEEPKVIHIKKKKHRHTPKMKLHKKPVRNKSKLNKKPFPKKKVPISRKTPTYEIGSIIYFKDNKTPKFTREGVVMGITHKETGNYILARTLKLENGKVVPELVEVKPLYPIYNIAKLKFDKRIPRLVNTIEKQR